MLKNVTNANDEIQWNKLYFIGHSLGAQISAQVSHFLKADKFWKVERITGLDPAKPCFIGVDKTLRLDKNDADFVDIIHTQIGKKNKPWGSLGIRKPIGQYTTRLILKYM